jgi:hypothetical protein
VAKLSAAKYAPVLETLEGTEEVLVLKAGKNRRALAQAIAALVPPSPLDAIAGAGFAVRTDGVWHLVDIESADIADFAAAVDARIAESGGGTVMSVDITPPAEGLAVSGGPITDTGSITLALADDLAALEALAGTGFAKRTGANTWALVNLGSAALLDADTDTALAANSDTLIATQKAVKAYVDSAVTGGAADVMIFKGLIDCSANPDYPAADAGNLYKVSVAGRIGGGAGPKVEVGDTLYCLADGTAAGTQAAVGASWNISQVNVDGAVIGPAAATDGHVAVYDGATGKLIKDSGLTLSGTNTGDETATTLGATVHGAASKATPVDADELPLVDSAAGNVLKRLTWANLKATLKTYFDTLYLAAGNALTNWTEAVNSSAPNATVPVVSLTATNAATNVDAALRVKGTGALLAQVPDNGTSGGSKRGTNAVDLQMSRNAAGQVASGPNAFSGNGKNNTVSGDSAGNGSGSGNTVSQTCGYNGGGIANLVSGVVGANGGGSSNTLSGDYSSNPGGTNNTVSGTRASCTGGSDNTSDGQKSRAGGYGAQTRGIDGCDAFASGKPFTNLGDAQKFDLVMGVQTSNGSPANMSVNGAGVGLVALPNNSDLLVDCQVVARQNTTGDSKSWTFAAHIKRGANAAATSLVAAVTPTVVANAAGAAAWTIAVSADTTNGALNLQVTGEAGKTIRWDVVTRCAQLVG